MLLFLFVITALLFLIVKGIKKSQSICTQDCY